MIYCPGSCTIITSEDITFNEHFSSTIATTWQQYKDGLGLHPVTSSIPIVNDTIEQTGDVDDVPNLVPFEQGKDNEEDEAEVDDEDDAAEVGTADAIVDESSDESSTFDIQPLPPTVEEPLHFMDNSHNL
jgi:hypothetical protein